MIPGKRICIRRVLTCSYCTDLLDIPHFDKELAEHIGTVPFVVL